jgi:hypothetical protein
MSKAKKKLVEAPEITCEVQSTKKEIYVEVCYKGKTYSGEATYDMGIECVYWDDDDPPEEIEDRINDEIRECAEND